MPSLEMDGEVKEIWDKRGNRGEIKDGKKRGRLEGEGEVATSSQP